jgi:hypothetical protein
MTWEEATVPAVRDGQPMTSRVRFVTGEVSAVEVSSGDEVSARGEGRDLFAALAAARRELEAQGVQLACNGARRDVYTSGMLRQAAQGRRAYVLTMPPTAARLPPTVDIFAAAPESSVLATVDEQREWFNGWRHSGTGNGVSR